MNTALDRARLALRLLAVDPGGLGGLHLRGRPGPVRRALEDDIAALPGPQRRIHPGISDEQLYGGIDLSATLNSGRSVMTRGILDDPCTLILPMAERCHLALAARLGMALDKGTHAVIAFDEGVEEDETLAIALKDRMAFAIDLTELSMRDVSPADHPPPGAKRTDAVHMPDSALSDLSQLAETLGVKSPRGVILALRAARANAALEGRAKVGPEDLSVAAALVLAPRATRLPPMDEPEMQEDEAPPPPPPDDMPKDEGQDAQTNDDVMIPQELLLEAAAAVLPADLLARVAVGKAGTPRSGGAGSGQARKGNRRGRPLPARPGRLDGTNRLDLIGTLRTAAPWQPLRRSAKGAADRALHVLTSDFRIKRYKEMSDRLLIFVVDASGSAAMTRLAEAKGAVELLLGEAYARRDHVALVAFRGEGAEVLLPPTRSLVQTKRRLAALPGGGGTPLAAGLQMAHALGLSARGKGMTPTIALLTDGRANIALNGTANRQEAGADATRLARILRGDGMSGLVIDMSPRPQKPLRALAEVLDAPYIPLPRADAKRLSAAVNVALEG